MVIMLSKLKVATLKINKQAEIIVKIIVIMKNAKTPLWYFNACDKMNNTKITAIEMEGIT